MAFTGIGGVSAVRRLAMTCHVVPIVASLFSNACCCLA